MSWNTVSKLKWITFIGALLCALKSNTISIIPGAKEDIRWYWPALILIVVWAGLVMFVEKVEDK